MYSYNIAAGTSRPTWKSKRAFVTRTTSVGRREGKCCSGLFLDVGDSLLRVSDGISLDFFIGCVYTIKYYIRKKKATEKQKHLFVVNM